MTAAPRRGVSPVVFGAGVWAGVIVAQNDGVSSCIVRTARGHAQGVGAVDGGVHRCGCAAAMACRSGDGVPRPHWRQFVL